MNAEAILGRINTLLVEQFELDEAALADDARLREDLQLDSLDAMDLIGLLEKEFEVALDDKRVMTLKTVGEVRAYVASLCAPSEEPQAS